MSIVNNRLLSSALHTTHRLARWEGNMRLASTRRAVACRCPASPSCQRWTRCPPAEVEQSDRRCHEAEIGGSSSSLSVTTGSVQDLDWAPADSLAPRTVTISVGLDLWICVLRSSTMQMREATAQSSVLKAHPPQVNMFLSSLSALLIALLCRSESVCHSHQC